MNRRYPTFTFGANLPAKQSGHLIRPAHPVIADALCEAGTRLADAFEPIWNALGVFVRRVFWTIVVVAPVAIYIANAFGLLA